MDRNDIRQKQLPIHTSVNQINAERVKKDMPGGILSRSNTHRMAPEPSGELKPVDPQARIKAYRRNGVDKVEMHAADDPGLRGLKDDPDRDAIQTAVGHGNSDELMAADSRPFEMVGINRLVNEPFKDNTTGYTTIDVHQISNHEAMLVSNNSILTEKSLVLMVYTLFSGIPFATMANFGNIFFPEKNQDQIFSLAEVIWCPNLLPVSFYFIILLTVTYTLGVVMTMSTIWSLNRRGWSFFSRAVMLFITGCTSLTYVMIVGKFVPRFYISTIGFNRLSSFSVVWLYVIALIGGFFAVWLLVKTAQTMFFRENTVSAKKNTA